MSNDENKEGKKGSGGVPFQKSTLLNIIKRYYRSKGITIKDSVLIEYKNPKDQSKEQGKTKIDKFINENKDQIRLLPQKILPETSQENKDKNIQTKILLDDLINKMYDAQLFKIGFDKETGQRDEGKTDKQYPEVSQDVKQSEQQPFTEQPDEQESVSAMEEQQGMINTPQPKTKSQILRSRLQKKIGKTKTNRSYEELLQEYKKPLQPIIDPKIIAQQEELRKTQEALRKLELTANMRESRIEQE